MSTLSEQSVTIPGTGTYKLDPSRSSITFVTRHMFGLGKVTGRFLLTDGDLVISEPVAASTVTARAAANSFDTRNKQRDRQVTSKTFLDTANHPDIVFRSTDITRDDRGWILRGRLTVRDSEAPIDFVIAESGSNGPELSIRATAHVDRYAHGLTKLKGMAARHLDLELLAQFRRV